MPVINKNNEVVGIVSRGDMIKKLREKLLGDIN
ncbi:CBS domain-containing protein [Peribacillus psychrosaccharolyticus]